jgi:hypothetical protein
LEIAAVWTRESRWLGYYTILNLAGLGWVPEEFYRSVFDEMLARGLLLQVQAADPVTDFTRYLHWSHAAGRRAR